MMINPRFPLLVACLLAVGFGGQAAEKPGWMIEKETYEANLKTLRPRGTQVEVGVAAHGVTTPAQAALLHRAGIRRVRRTIYWNLLEKPDGTWNEDYLRDWDKAEAASREQGLELLAVVHEAPQGLDWAHRSEAYQRFASAVGRLAARYPGIRNWELWNEMDLSFTDLFGAKRKDMTLRERGKCYAEMLRLAAPAIRRANPQAQIVMGGMASQDGEFLEGIYDGGGQGYFDVANVHTYGEPILWRFVNTAVLLRAILERHGDGRKPLWNTEFGNSGGQTVVAWGIPKGRDLGEYLDEKQRELVTECVTANRKYSLYDVAMIYVLQGEAEGTDREVAARGGKLPAGRTGSDYGYSLLRSDGVTPRPTMEWLMANPDRASR